MVWAAWRNHFTALETGKRAKPKRRCIDCGVELFRKSSAKRCGPCSDVKNTANLAAYIAKRKKEAAL